MLMEQAYKGPERRIEQRRKSEDRRDMLRFEPTKDPRRTGKDRRLKSIWDNRNIILIFPEYISGIKNAIARDSCKKSSRQWLFLCDAIY